jgi:hypothetical protein
MLLCVGHLIMYVVTISRNPTHQEIKSLAEKKWKLAGCPTGKDEEFWIAAEKQLKRRLI